MKSLIRLSDHFSFSLLLRFTLPTVLMMIFASVYVIIDGLFVANCVGKDAFAAVNLIWPFPMLIGAIGYMFGTGGCALVSKFLGEGEKEKARGFFTMFTIITTFVSCILSIIGYIFMDDVVNLLGVTNGSIHDDCVTYGNIIVLSITFFTLQTLWQPFMIAAEKPIWGLSICLIAGFINILLDVVFILYLGLGVKGAGLATLISQMSGAILPILFFIYKRPSDLYFSYPIFDWEAIVKACTNGFSEFIINVSIPLINLLYVYSLWHLAGENGVGAYGVIMYVNVIFFSIFSGFSMGSAPVISYNYGASNYIEVRNINKLIIRLLMVTSIFVCFIAELLAPLLAWAFAHGDRIFQQMIYEAFTLYSFSFLFSPYNIYASALFTALNNGYISATISFSRIVFFQVAAILILPHFWGIHGFWIALPSAEIMSLSISLYYYITYRKRYNY